MLKEMKKITREYVQAHPEFLFLFGDNLQQQGYGGQAKAMRGEPNAVGIPTKKKPTMDDDAFFTDEELEENKAHIDDAIMEILKKKPDFDRKKHTIIIPAAGLGTGLAQLPERAPKTYAYINKRLREFKK